MAPTCAESRCGRAVVFFGLSAWKLGEKGLTVAVALLYHSTVRDATALAGGRRTVGCLSSACYGAFALASAHRAAKRAKGPVGHFGVDLLAECAGWAWTMVVDEATDNADVAFLAAVSAAAAYVALVVVAKRRRTGSLSEGLRRAVDGSVAGYVLGFAAHRLIRAVESREYVLYLEIVAFGAIVFEFENVVHFFFKRKSTAWSSAAHEAGELAVAVVEHAAATAVGFAWLASFGALRSPSLSFFFFFSKDAAQYTAKTSLLYAPRAAAAAAADDDDDDGGAFATFRWLGAFFAATVLVHAIAAARLDCLVRERRRVVARARLVRTAAALGLGFGVEDVLGAAFLDDTKPRSKRLGLELTVVVILTLGLLLLQRRKKPVDDDASLGDDYHLLEDETDFEGGEQPDLEEEEKEPGIAASMTIAPAGDGSLRSFSETGDLCD